MRPMTRTQYEHHAEQMEAYRKEFSLLWGKFLERARHNIPGSELAMMELKFWNRWYAEKKEGKR